MHFMYVNVMEENFEQGVHISHHLALLDVQVNVLYHWIQGGH